jgi:tetratricopeptide (TPR) repeat protein
VGDDVEAKRRELKERAERLLALDYFALLGVSRTATADEVARAFAGAAKTWHPDRLPQGLEDLGPTFMQVFARLDAARATLADASLRLRYATDLAKHGAGAPSGGAEGASAASAAADAEADLELRKAEALFKKQDLAGAERHLRRAVQLAPSKPEPQAMLVWLLATKPDCTKERLRELAVDLGRVIDREPSCERAWFYRALLRKRLDLVEEAAADFARAAELDPRNLDAAREVRLHEMRKAKRAAPPPEEPGGLGGFFRRLVKR